MDATQRDGISQPSYRGSSPKITVHIPRNAYRQKRLQARKKLIAGNTIHLLVKCCYENLYVKHCYIRLFTHICKNEIEAFFLSFCILSIFKYHNIKSKQSLLKHPNKVHIQGQHKFTSSVTLGLFLLAHMLNSWQNFGSTPCSSSTNKYLKFFAIF
jgi:hypothetical protein